MQVRRLKAFLLDGAALKLVGFYLVACLASYDCLQCYVCGDDAEQHCNDYDSSNQHLFIKDCPAGSEGCSSKINADSVVLSRACETVSANACQNFQDFKYCYCHVNLCNGISSKPSSFPSDDEDIDDGSGMEERKPNPTFSTPAKTSSSNLLEKCNLLLAIIFCVAFLI